MDTPDPEKLNDELRPYLDAPPEMDFIVERETVVAGRSFSAEAMDRLFTHINGYIGVQLIKAWRARREPPSRMTVTVRVEVS